MQLKQRFIDDKEPFEIKRDIEGQKKGASPEHLKYLEKIESDIKKVLHAFDTKKKIQSPKNIINIFKKN